MLSRGTALAAAVSTVALALVLGACGGDKAPPAQSTTASAQSNFGPPPAVADSSLDPDVQSATSAMMDAAADGRLDRDALEVVAAAGDPRLAWLVSDLLRFFPAGADQGDLVAAFMALTETDPRTDPGFARSPWQSITNHLFAWELPAPPDYRELKAKLFVSVEPGWEPFFADAESEIDWRFVSWGGVLIDDRPEGSEGLCPGGCIPALDDPALTDTSQGDWFPDDGIVFGVTVNGESVAFPKNVMEVHEMVNVTIGGRRLGIPYCTLCGSAQAYFLDEDSGPGEQPVLRTSGLLSRSNKVMYDLNTNSVFDTFTGEAISGPLREAGITLPQTTVVASTWGEWKRSHPETRIVAEDGGIGRDYPADPLAGRDDDGPIFPIGDPDPRLPVQANVIGVITAGGRAVAFPAEEARAALREGEEVSAAGIELRLDGDGLRATGSGARDVPSHQAFWFAWSQFHPGTVLWDPAPAQADR